MADSNGAPELGFAAALEELEAILARLDDDEVGIDELATELERAAQLLELCRERLRAADLEVNRIVDRLEEDAPAEGAANTSAEGEND